MGWAGGSALAGEVFDIVLPHVPQKDKLNIIREVVEVFEERDADTMCELIDHDDSDVRDFIADYFSDPDADEDEEK